MSTLPLSEQFLFALALGLHFVAAAVGVLQLQAGKDKFRRLSPPLIALAIILETIILIFRAKALSAFPLTSLFESMIMLTAVLGLTYLLLYIPLRHVWFSSAMAWILLPVMLLAAVVARPPAEPNVVVATPWAISHGIAMMLSGVAVMLASAGGALYLYSEHRLKQKKAAKLFGRMPNIENLAKLNVFGLKAAFALMTLGLAGGVGMAAAQSDQLQISITQWLMDPKIILTVIVWLLLAMILILHHLGKTGTRLRMYITLIAFALILFAIVGVTLLSNTRHDFSKQTPATIETTG